LTVKSRDKPTRPPGDSRSRFRPNESIGLNGKLIPLAGVYKAGAVVLKALAMLSGKCSASPPATVFACHRCDAVLHALKVDLG
jgi:hypothetical protein